MKKRENKLISSKKKNDDNISKISDNICKVSKSSDEIGKQSDEIGKNVEIKEVFRWRNKFPFEEDRLTMLVIYDKNHESYSSLDLIMNGLKLLFPANGENKKLSEILSIKKENNEKRRVETKIDGMIPKDSDKTNTTESTTIVDISSIKEDKSMIEIYNKFQDYVYDNTHILATVSSDAIINNYYELFDVILFMNPYDSNDFLNKRYFKKVEKNNYSNQGIIVDNREYYYAISFYNFIRLE